MSETISPTRGESLKSCHDWCSDHEGELTSDVDIHRRSFGEHVGVECSRGFVDLPVIDLYVDGRIDLTADEANSVGRWLIEAAAFLRAATCGTTWPVVAEVLTVRPTPGPAAGSVGDL